MRRHLRLLRLQAPRSVGISSILYDRLANYSSGAKSDLPPASINKVTPARRRRPRLYRLELLLSTMAEFSCCDRDRRACKAKNVNSLAPTESLLTSAPERAHEVRQTTSPL